MIDTSARRKSGHGQLLRDERYKAIYLAYLDAMGREILAASRQSPAFGIDFCVIDYYIAFKRSPAMGRATTLELLTEGTGPAARLPLLLLMPGDVGSHFIAMEPGVYVYVAA